MSIGIYQIQNKLNGKNYIGQSNDIEKRWREHLWDARREDHGYLLYRAIRKYGEDNFDFLIIETFDIYNVDILNEREQYWIKFYNSFMDWSDGGYNMTTGGGSCEVSHERCQKISESLKGQVRLWARGKPSGAKGKKWSEESRQKVSEALKGHYAAMKGKHFSKKYCEKHRARYTPEVREKMRQSHLGQVPGNKGKPMSAEARKKMSDAKKGKPAPNLGVPRTDAQKQVDKEVALVRHLKKGNLCVKMIKVDGEILYFTSANECAVRLGLSTTLSARITRRMNGLPDTGGRHEIIKSSQFEYCSQQEFLNHRPELKKYFE
jgi:group I intron endonuclease